MKFLKDITEQVWTLVGLVIGYIVLEGTAKELTGYLILAALTIWVATFWLRNRE